MKLKIAFLTVLIFSSLGCEKFIKARMAESESKIKVNRAQTQAIVIYTALKMFYVDCGKYPTSAEGLAALKQKPASCSAWGPAPYLETLEKDPWDRDFNYKSDGDTFTLKSLGADGAEGGEGENIDIVRTDKQPL